MDSQNPDAQTHTKGTPIIKASVGPGDGGVCFSCLTGITVCSSIAVTACNVLGPEWLGHTDPAVDI